MSNVKNYYDNPVTSPQAAATEGFDLLVSLALDMRWSWNHNADELWQQLDPALWAETHNPWLVLQSVSGEQVQRLLSTPAFRTQLDALGREREEDDAAPGWFATTYPNAPLKT